MAATQQVPSDADPSSAPRLHPRIRTRSIVLVGLMGAGKTTVGRALASALHMPFRDADHEIERAARRSVAEIFADRGEAEFRDGERRVIARLLTREQPHVLASGGGAFVQPDTRAVIQGNALSVWLKVDLDVLVRRVSRKNTRPLLHNRDPHEVLSNLAEQRYPAYAQAELTVDCGDVSTAMTVDVVLAALNAHFYAQDAARAEARARAEQGEGA
jgi:shikimate kinase